jgi:nucleoid-associated protein YgaU
MVKTLVRLYDPEDQTELVFATRPAEITTDAASEDADIRLDHFGTLSRPMGRPPTRYSWAGTFYGWSRASDPYVETPVWRPPEDIKYQLETWHDGQPRRVLPLELEVVNGPIRMLKPVYITALNFNMRGAFADLPYTLTLTEWRNVLIGEYTGPGGEEPVDETMGQDPEVGEPPVLAEYTVKPGDTLWRISEDQLGDGARYGEIYELNQDVIGDNVDYITPGTTLLMPGGTADVEEPAIPDVVDYLGYLETPE